MVTREDVTGALDGFERVPVERPDLKAAAVAITLVEDAGTTAFLLTRRATTLRGHAGQWALPGGRADDGEDPGETARRKSECPKPTDQRSAKRDRDCQQQN